MNGRTALEHLGNQRSGRAARGRDFSNFCDRGPYSMGLGLDCFMLRRPSSPMVRSIARRSIRPSRGAGQPSRNFLRGKLAGDPAQDVANRLPSVSINRLRHVRKHGEAGEQAFAKNVQGVACVYS